MVTEHPHRESTHTTTIPHQPSDQMANNPDAQEIIRRAEESTAQAQAAINQSQIVVRSMEAHVARLEADRYRRPVRAFLRRIDALRVW